MRCGPLYICTMALAPLGQEALFFELSHQIQILGVQKLSKQLKLLKTNERGRAPVGVIHPTVFLRMG